MTAPSQTSESGEPIPNVGTARKMWSVEYAHMYADEVVGTEQRISAAHADEAEPTPNSPPSHFGHLTDIQPGAQYVTMVDDYNVRQQFQQRHALAAAQLLDEAGRRPDLIFGESSFANHAISLLHELEGRIGSSQVRYLDKHSRLTCSLLTAAWYLTRLDVYSSPRDRLHGLGLTPAVRLLNILPRIYEDTEQKVHDVLKASPYAWAIDSLHYEWIDTVKPWEHMKAFSYFEDNYETPHPVDLHLAHLLLLDWAGIGPAEHVVEIGTGPNLMPVLAALPYITKQLLVTDYSQANRTWLENALAKIDPGWLRFQSTDRAIGELQTRANVVARVHDLSVYHMPSSYYDVASMHFVAESITDSPVAFHMALSSIHDSLKPGGHLLASFMLGSTGWNVAGAHFPAVSLTENDVTSALTSAGFDRFDPVRLHEGAEPVRDGYTGMLYVHARRSR
jgi:SAM-dependent methyltransferase